MKSWKYAALLMISFALPFIAIANYTLNHFYVSGGGMLDDAWFAHLAAHSTTWPIQNPPWLGGTYFNTHFSIIFVLLAYAYQGLCAVGLSLREPVWFSLTQALWVGLMGASLLLLLLRPGKPAQPAYIATATALAVLGALNGASLSCIVFPHFEVAIPALFVTFFALYLRGWNKSALLALLLGLLTREDAGLHYFGVFLLLALYQRFFAKAANRPTVLVPALALAASCLAYSIAAIAAQKTFYPGDDALARIYLGHPAFAHLNATLIGKRLFYFLVARLYFWLPMALTIFWSIRRTQPLLALGALAVMPWILFSLTGISSMASTLGNYYAFPIVIAVLWPAITLDFYEPAPPRSEAHTNAIARLLIPAAVMTLSIVLYPSARGNLDRQPWKTFTFGWLGKVAANHDALEKFITANAAMRFTTTDAPAALLGDRLTGNEWKYMLDVDMQKTNIDTLIFQPGAWLADEAKNKALTHGLTTLCHIDGSNFFAYTKRGDLIGCSQE